MNEPQNELKNPTASTWPEESPRSAFLYSLPGVLLVLFVYSLVHVVARLLASSNLGEDDPLDNLLIQTLAPGYSTVQGPLYDWVLWLLQQGVGNGVHAFLLLKYGLLIAMAGFLFLIAQRVMSNASGNTTGWATNNALWAFMAVDAMSLVYQIFWRFHEGFTHRIGAMVLAVMTFWALMQVIDRARHRDYALFATFVGMGLLTEHTYLVFLLALLLAALLQPVIRRRVFAVTMLVFLPVAALIVSPYAAWLMADSARSAAFVAAFWPFAADRSLAEMGEGLSRAFTFPIYVLLPYLFILPLVFPGMLKTLWKRAPRPAGDERVGDGSQTISQLLLHMLGIELLMLVLFGVLSSRQESYSVHSLLPLFVLAIVWLTNKARESAPSPKRIKVFVAIMLTLTVLAFIGRAANMFVLDPVCKMCRWGTPYGELANVLKARGFTEGTLVTNDVELGGNMQRFFAHSRVEVPGWVTFPRSEPAQAMAIVWTSRDGSLDVPGALRPYLKDAPPELIQVPWQHLWRPDGYRNSTWGVAIQR